MASTVFFGTTRTHIFEQNPLNPTQSPPNPTRGPEIDVLRFKVVKAPPPPPPNETLYVNEFTVDHVDWTAHGASPYLNATEDGNYIEGTTDTSRMAWFSFENITLGDAEIKEVVLEGYTNGSYNEAVDYDIYAEEGFTWIGSLYATGEPAWVTPRWIGHTVDEAYPAVLTEDGLNSLQVMAYFYDPQGHGGAGNIIDALRLKVWYQEPTDVYTQRLGEMQNCTIDALTRLIRPSDIDTLESECYTITSAPGFHMGHIGFNIRPDQSYRRADGLLVGKILSDVWFRFALFKCYDQDNIIASIYNNTVTPIGSLVPPALGGWVNPSIPKIPYNPGDKYGSGEWPSDNSACGVLRYANYTYDPVEDNWRTPVGWGAEGDQLIPGLHCFTPTYEVSPASAEHGARWIADCNNIGLTGMIHEPAEFSPYLDQVFGNANFDMYMVFWGLGRFPDYLYDMLHSSQDCQFYPWGYNSPGVNDPGLDVLLEVLKFSLDYDAKKVAAYEIQERLYDYNCSGCAFSYMTLYSRLYFDGFNPGLRGIVNSPGYTSDNMWTFLNMRWESGHPYERIEDGNSTVIWCLDMEPELLNPCYANTNYAWGILDRIFDPLITIGPYNHEDLPWIATSWSVGQFTGTVTLDSDNRYLNVNATQTVDITDGMRVTFTLRDDVEWHDGNLYTPADAEFSLEFLRNNEIPRYVSMWQHLVDVQVNNSTAFTVYSDVLNLQFLYDFADDAALLPSPVWSWLDGQPQETILGYDPSANTTTPTGAGPRFGTDACPTQLYGTGPFVFDYYDPTEDSTDLYANRYYFKTTDEMQAQLVELFWVCGDINRDGVVDQVDQDCCAAAYGSTPGEPNWDPDCDVNSDGVINEEDEIIISYFMGKRREYPAEVVDVAILDVTTSPTVVLPGEEINITVIAKNKGNAGFTTNLTYYYDNIFIDNQTVANLIPCHNTTIYYTWDTTGVPPGLYTISVNATILDGVDANLADNIFIDGTVIAGIYIESNTTIANVSVTRNSLNFTTSGPTGEGAYVNITMPVGLNKTAISVFIDGAKLEPPPFPIITANVTHYFIYFEFTQSIHNITVLYAITDIAVTNVTPSETVVEQGHSLSIDVTIENQGNFTESFNATAYCNETAITLPNGKNYTAVTLSSGNSTVITFTWNTTGFALGNYTLSAAASVVPGETDTADNTYVDDIITIVVLPVADFTYSPEYPAPNMSVTFNATLSTPNGGTIVSYAWDFDDGNATTVTTPIITHIYNSSATYNVTLTVTDSEDQNGTTWKTVPVYIHDVAVISVVPSDAVVVEGDSISINVTIVNQGGSSEIFNVTGYANTTIIDTLSNATLSSGNSTVIIFTWNTTGFALGNYTLSAAASVVPGETDTADNTYVDDIVTLVALHDIAVMDIEVWPRDVPEGQLVNIDVTVENQGGITEAFNVSVCYDGVPIDTKTVDDLAPNSTRIVNFTWNTTAVAWGSYTISVNASVVIGEVDTTDNTFIDGTVSIRGPVLIVEVISCNQTGFLKGTFSKGAMAFFKITLNNTALELEGVLITLNIYDSDSVTIGVASFQGSVAPGVSIPIFGLPIPTFASIGSATGYANVYTDWPHIGGFPHGPEGSTTFEIIN